MIEHFTRRHDLFEDAGFADPGAALEALAEDARAIGLLGAKGGADDGADDDRVDGRPLDLSARLSEAGRLAGARLPARLCRFLDASIEWMFDRGGDLSTFLWLAHRLAERPDLGAVVFGLGHRLLESGRGREAAGLVRFLVNLDFDFGKLYAEPGLAYGFFEPREPNPFVWKILDHVEERARRQPEAGLNVVEIVELGSGIGNDAMGFLTSERVAGYTGTDLSAAALRQLEERAVPATAGRPAVRVETRAGDFLGHLDALAGETDRRPWLVYSYSSLHYFSSRELDEIFRRVRRLLEPGRGLFAFAVKGQGSIWDGQGVPLYRPDVWINCDGQSRWFPSRPAIVAMTDRLGYEIRMHETAEHWGYSEHGRKDVFHYVICSPRG